MNNIKEEKATFLSRKKNLQVIPLRPRGILDTTIQQSSMWIILKNMKTDKDFDKTKKIF
jgi:hypothetical protein